MKEFKFISTADEIIEILKGLNPSIEHDELIDDSYIDSFKELEKLELFIDHDDLDKEGLLDLLDELDSTFNIEYGDIKTQIWCDVIYIGGFTLKNFKYLC